jgi:hypothetical protein
VPLQPAQQILGVQQEAADEHVFLVGRPPIQEYLGYVESRTVEGQTMDRAALMKLWRNANDHIGDLETAEAGVADGATAEPLTGSLAERASALLADPSIATAYATVPTEIAMVELDSLVVFQKQINLAHVHELSELLPDDASTEDIFDFALPTDGRYDPPIQVGQIAQNCWSFVSPSTDLRVLDFRMVDPRAVAGLSVGGRPTAIVAAIVGYGANLLSAISVEGRLLVGNGSHRAYTLRAAGHTRVPCLIQNLSRRDELELVAPEIQQNADLYLKAPRPPLLKDYFDEQLHIGVHVRRSRRQLNVAITPQMSETPGA